MAAAYAVIIVLIIVLIFLFSAVKVAREYERGVVFRLGRLIGIDLIAEQQEHSRAIFS